MASAFIDAIDPKDFDFVSTKLRAFFKSRGLIEVACQHRLAILSACEDPKTVGTFQYLGQVWPLVQTGQMQLEHEILLNPNVPGYFCLTFSYRQESNPVHGRHNLIFPMIEFEIPGDMTVLQEFQKDLLQYLGYRMDDYKDKQYPEGNYVEVAKQYGTETIEHEHEQKIYQDRGPVFFLKNFPESTAPFFNMKRHEDSSCYAGTAKKIDVLLSGIETFGSAERCCDPEAMRKRFYETNDGSYANMLFSHFGKERVERELEEFLSHKFVVRSGCGIGVTRLIRSLKMEKLM